MYVEAPKATNPPPPHFISTLAPKLSPGDLMDQDMA